MSPRLSWVVAGGGTGGHVTPALALGERIAERGDDVVFLGGQRGLEGRLVPRAGFELVQLPAQPLMGRGWLGRIAALGPILRASRSALRLLRERRADLVVSVGGYASLPAVLAAALSRTPLALVEPNAVPGRTNRYSARFARRVFVQFEGAARRLGSAGAVLDLGIPLRRALIEAFGPAAPRRTPAPPFRLLVFGGSQGARQINDALCEAAASLDPTSLEIFHQTGEADRERLERAYREAGLRAEVVAFETDMPARYRWADLALCRSGALTVAELQVAGLGALLVPYPHAADDHQLANARALAEAGAARVLDSRSFRSSDLVEQLEQLFAAPEELSRMSDRAAKRARPDAAERVVEACVAMLGPQAGER